MNPSIGVNLNKEIKSMMKRIKIPAITHVEECIYCCDEDPEYDFDKDCCEIIDECCENECCKDEDSFDIKDYFNFEMKMLAYIGVGLAIGVIITSLFKR